MIMKVIENQGQAMPKGAMRAAMGSRSERRARVKAAAMDLMDVSRRTLVVAHLHPRWLRQRVEEAMGRGVILSEDGIARLRRLGPARA